MAQKTSSTSPPPVGTWANSPIYSDASLIGRSDLHSSHYRMQYQTEYRTSLSTQSTQYLTSDGIPLVRKADIKYRSRRSSQHTPEGGLAVCRAAHRIRLSWTRYSKRALPLMIFSTFSIASPILRSRRKFWAFNNRLLLSFLKSNGPSRSLSVV